MRERRQEEVEEKVRNKRKTGKIWGWEERRKTRKALRKEEENKERRKMRLEGW